MIELEISNLLTNEERKIIDEEIKMTPKAMAVVTKAINEVNQKVLAETWDDAHAEGLAEGLAEGMDEGRVEGRADAMKDFAKALKNQVDIDRLSEVTGLSVDEIKQL